MTDIKALREKIATADPLPWSWDSYGTVSSIPRCREYQEFERRHEAAGEPWDEEGNYPEPWKSQEPEVVVCSVKYPGGAANAQAIEAGMNALLALLDELEALRDAPVIVEFDKPKIKTLREEKAGYKHAAEYWNKHYHEEYRRAEAAEAKLAKVRKVAAGTADWNDPERQAGDGFVRGQLLAILDAEPPTATVQPPTAEGEQG